jgi:hypothetical protein
MMGPGAPFEIIEEEVMGTRHEVFARRYPHLRALFEDGTTRNGDRPYLVHGEHTITFVEAASAGGTASLLPRPTVTNLSLWRGRSSCWAGSSWA